MSLHQGQPSWFRLTIGCILAVVFCPLEPVAADWKERLLSEAPPKWIALEQYYSKMDASLRKTFAVSSEGKPFPLTFQGTIYYDTRQNGAMMVSTHHYVGKDGEGKQVNTTIVHGANSRYAFTLGKAAPDAESFILSNFEPLNDQVLQKVHGSGGGENDIGLAFMVQGVRLVEYIKNPHFTFDAHRAQPNGKEMVQLEYERKLMKRDRNAPSQTMPAGIEHGVVLLDPEHFWCVREYHVNNPNWKIDGTVEYGDEVDGFPILRRCQHIATHKQLGTEIITYEFDKLIHRDIPESEFTLSAFGFPEVQVPDEQKPRILWRWLIGIGVALGVVSVLLRVYVKRKRQVPQTNLRRL